jgi:hypothetical protein
MASEILTCTGKWDNTQGLDELDWGDASLSGFVWENGGTDLRLFLAHASRPISALVCSWASDLRVDLEWRRGANPSNESAPRGGPLLSTEGRITRTPGGRWHLRLAFGSDGELQFECGAIHVVATSTGAV